MRHLPLTTFATFVCASLCACGFMTPAKQYSGDTKSAREIAVIKSHIGSPLGDEYHATIVSYAQNSKTGEMISKQFGLPGFTDYPKEIHLRPGRYMVTAYCFKSLSMPTFKPTIEIVALAARTYIVKCMVLDGNVSLSVNQDESGA